MRKGPVWWGVAMRSILRKRYDAWVGLSGRRSSGKRIPTESDEFKLMAELEQAREDQRVSLNHILQVIAVGITGLTLIPAVGGSGVNPILLACLEAGIAIALLAYSTSVGMERSFRYHYMCQLESMIRKDEKDPFPGWNEASAPLITLNSKKVKTKYGKMHYAHLKIALLAILAVCLMLVFAFVKPSIELMGGFVAAGVAFTVIYVHFGYNRATSNTREMYRETMEEVKERRKAEESSGCDATSSSQSPMGSSKQSVSSPSQPVAGAGVGALKNQPGWKSWIRFIFYCLYPRPKDCLKRT